MEDSLLPKHGGSWNPGTATSPQCSQVLDLGCTFSNITSSAKLFLITDDKIKPWTQDRFHNYVYFYIPVCIAHLLASHAKIFAKFYQDYYGDYKFNDKKY